ncbi:hypothetical protein [Halomarina pelagica]|uniref:hypothetical protein n=1 Tax=Halomarina pelagica TaxID=2961599 RepID=UPI0020C49ECD|nr:hypothetical protein [Halomarina sp. BND7]
MVIAAQSRRLPAFGVKVVLAVAVLAGLHLLAQVSTVRLLQIPGYLIMAGVDLIQNTVLPGLSGLEFDALYAVYLVIVAVVLTLLVRAVYARTTA